ncbi:hypothetical protein [Polynucleobacter sp. 39-46-10]|jgi:hypothetical protein|uniref:hypothetical protein n=1 Tax=Polynucleobacter sp. 39-46-10 TaxID=1970428 RepID=UPI000BCA6599|nr:hypothetical protein [Polynucleobacter sp. 39-46-10]OZA77723.1 MAG: hypothetical protein B7X71_03850 [Polynucleobacter sp. 39-46-10]
MKRNVDIYSKGWSPDIIWTYIVSLDGVENTEDLKKNEVEVTAFEREALRLAIAENRGDPNTLFARARE